MGVQSARSTVINYALVPCTLSLWHGRKVEYLIGCSHTRPAFDISYPTSALQDGTHGGFTVDVRAHLWAPAATAGTVAVTTEWGATASQHVSVPMGESDVTLKMTATAAQIKLWWPAGHGAQVRLTSSNPLWLCDMSPTPAPRFHLHTTTPAPHAHNTFNCAFEIVCVSLDSLS
jgi:hypothetical protein